MAFVIVEEHPELDTPIGRAQGAVEAAGVKLGEQRDIVGRLVAKADRARAQVAMCEQQLAEAQAEVPEYETELAEALVALAAIEREN